jgi:uncharacterized protein (DUF924 family)
MTVHLDPSAAASAVLGFWFGEVGKDRWYAKDAALDRDIKRRFGAMRDIVFADRAEGWRERVDTFAAAIILLDQFSRNMFRGSARAFEADPLALELAMSSLDRGWTHAAPHDWRQFLLMPLQHSEDRAVQERSVAEFDRLGDPLNVDFARRHRDQIVRFGRFPGRNQALGRVSSEAERALIERGETF